ncbi:MAG: hypothetical protein JST01_17640 [Cyanobacteria bacterium SZAS TMP-1]|nr:hypothetical protein [Cyanobacteria bacterium SZAS TMP-1]
MLRDSHTAPRVLIAVALTTGLALGQLTQAEPAGAFNLGKRKQEPTNQQSIPAFDPTATPLEPEEAGAESTDKESIREAVTGRESDTPQSTPQATPQASEATEKTETPAESEMTPAAEIPEVYTQPPREKPNAAAPEQPPAPDTNAALRQVERSKNVAEPAAIIQLAPPIKMTADEISPFVVNPKYAEHKRNNEAEPAAASSETNSDGSQSGDGFKSENTDPDMGDKPKKTQPIAAKELTKAEREKQIKRQDFSSKFSYVLPEGWRTYQIPFQTHDVLSLRQANKIVATINFSDEFRKSNLEKLKDLTIEKNQEDDPKYKLVESEIESLPDGKACAKILGTGEVDEVKARRLQYIIALTKKHHLVVTLTVGKIMGDKYDKVLHDVVASVSTEAFVTRLK